MTGSAGAAHDLPTARDLAAEASAAARRGGPLIVIFSRPDCTYCEIVKRDYLLPLSQNPRYRDRVAVRQVNQDSAQVLHDWRGQRQTHAGFAAAEKVKLVPVVAFYGADGRRLADPIVGTRLPDFYASYLEAAIEQSTQQMKKP